MPRRAKTTERDNNSQAAPPPESEEDRLIRTGIVMWLAREKHGDAITNKDVDTIIESEPPLEQLFETLPAHLRPYLADLGKQDPRRFIERLKQSCQNLLVLCKSEEEKQNIAEMLSTLADLELVLALRRYGGRPKGTRKKVTPDVIENIRKWKAGDRTWVSGSSVADVASKLNVSRQTVYTILDEIKAEDGKRRDAPAVADEPS